MTEDNRPTHVIYHHPCFDGFSAAWAAWRRYGDVVEYVPANYGDDLPDLPEGARVVMVDVSWPREDLERLRESVESLLILDHHATAEEALDGFPGAVFDMERSGARMAWDHFHEEPPPRLVQYVEDRDLWRFQHKGTRRIHAYLSSHRFDFGQWDGVYRLLEEDLQLALDRGETVLAYRDRRVEDMLNSLHVVLIDGPDGAQWTPALNLGVKAYTSEALHEVLERHPEEVMAAAYARGPDGGWYYSLRSVEDFDCSVYAVHNGGGGHPQASGFRSDVPPVYVGPYDTLEAS